MFIPVENYTSSHSSIVGTGYDAAGHLKGYLVVPPDSKPEEQYLYKTDYAYFDSYKQDTLTIKLNQDGRNKTFSDYDQNGNLVKVREPQAGGASKINRMFVNDADGHLLRSEPRVDGAVSRSLVVNGEMLGSYGGRGSAMVGRFSRTYHATATPA